MDFWQSRELSQSQEILVASGDALASNPGIQVVGTAHRTYIGPACRLTVRQDGIQIPSPNRYHETSIVQLLPIRLAVRYKAYKEKAASEVTAASSAFPSHTLAKYLIAA